MNVGTPQPNIIPGLLYGSCQGWGCETIATSVDTFAAPLDVAIPDPIYTKPRLISDVYVWFKALIERKQPSGTIAYNYPEPDEEHRQRMRKTTSIDSATITEVYNIHGHIEYVIQVKILRRDGTTTVITSTKRYRQFYAFNEYLASKYPAPESVISLMPPKTWFPNTSYEFVKMRKIALQKYIDAAIECGSSRYHLLHFLIG